MALGAPGTVTPPAQTNPGGSVSVLAIGLLVLAGGLVGYVATLTSASAGHRAAAAVVALFLVVALGVVVHVGLLWYQSRSTGGISSRAAAASDRAANLVFRRRGLKAAFVGADGRVSTSKTQVCLWTAFLIAAFVYLLVLTRSYPGGTLFSNAVTTNWRPEYLVLVGLPVSAATIAKGAVLNSNKGVGVITTEDAKVIHNAPAGVTAAQLGVKSVSPTAAATLTGSPRLYMRDNVPAGVNGSMAGLAELVTDDTGTLAWPDLQYVLFTLITLVSFCAQVISSPTSGLPPVPAALLTLMGVSSAGYAANKMIAAQGTTPPA